MSRRKKPDLPSFLSSLFTVDTSERASKGISISLARTEAPAEPRPETAAPKKREPKPAPTSATFVQMPLPLAVDRFDTPAPPSPVRPPRVSAPAWDSADASGAADAPYDSLAAPGGVRLVNGRVVRESRHPDSEWSAITPAFGVVAEPTVEYGRGVGPRGYVRYARAGNGPGTPLSELEYVVVDVETTGAPASRGHRITEVSIVHADLNGRIVDEFSTLVNPGRSIPAMISAITNITTDMVADAPTFAEIAEEVRHRLEGRVFVAHNAGFDWHFLSTELQIATGTPLRGKLLCTVRMARKFVPEIPKRSLDALSYYFGIENEARHRAYGDARATADIFGRLMARAEEREIRHWNELQRTLYARRRKGRRRRSAMPRMMDYLP